jgi:hypothetical protein
MIIIIIIIIIIKIIIRNGVLFLESNNVELLGGEVENLSETNALVELLQNEL